MRLEFVSELSLALSSVNSKLGPKDAPLAFTLRAPEVFSYKATVLSEERVRADAGAVQDSPWPSPYNSHMIKTYIKNNCE